eukprot:50347_1
MRLRMPVIAGLMMLTRTPTRMHDTDMVQTIWMEITQKGIDSSCVYTCGNDAKASNNIILLTNNERTNYIMWTIWNKSDKDYCGGTRIIATITPIINVKKTNMDPKSDGGNIIWNKYVK